MGMSNEQFDSYKKLLMRRLEKIIKEVDKEKMSKELEELIEDFREELRKP